MSVKRLGELPTKSHASGERMVVLIFGDRAWSDEELIRQFMLSLPVARTTIVEGDCGNDDYTVGADRIAGRIAKELGMKLKVYPANWSAFNRAAGPIRNGQMLKENPDITMAVAFHDDLAKSRGTKDMMQRCFSYGLKVLLINHREQRYVHSLGEAGVPLEVNRKWR